MEAVVNEFRECKYGSVHFWTDQDEKITLGNEYIDMEMCSATA